jgi:hypothetical protein
MNTCRKCVADNEEQARFCRKCGAALDGESGGGRAPSAMTKTEDDLEAAKLKGGRIIDQWLMLISGAHGRGDALTNRVAEILKQAKTPSLTVEHKAVHLGFLSRMFKGTRKFLVVENEYLHGYRVFIGARDYGEQLSVSWYLTLEQPFFRRIAGTSWFLLVIFYPLSLCGRIWRFITGRRYITPEQMDLFDIEELSSYASTVHQATKEATNELIKDMNLNSAKVSTQTRGFLNIT